MVNTIKRDRINPMWVLRHVRRQERNYVVLYSDRIEGFPDIQFRFLGEEADSAAYLYEQSLVQVSNVTQEVVL